MANVPQVSVNSLSPAQMADKAVNVGIAKVKKATATLFVSGMLAGIFIGFGAIFATTVATGAGDLPFGVAKLLIGLVFCLGLVLVIVGGAELFTGNNLIVMAWLNKKVTFSQLLRNWGWVYLGNFVGSVLLAYLVFLSKQYTFAGGALGEKAMAIANGKCSLEFVQAIALGALCNMLVCLAVWVTFSARTVVGKIAALTLPIAGFVAAGFEHSVANMYFIAVGLFIKAGTGATEYAALTWSNFFLKNLLPVTIGNIIGGGIFISGLYWFVFLRDK
ncbi:MAG: formate transporter FocA [Chloroflexi bacterium]|nr:formate/nitrite transporter family protein [Anaerolineae bacterium]RLC86192.1 MAG: formate transporter FocA [Chloroflexota bacterium]